MAGLGAGLLVVLTALARMAASAAPPAACTTLQADTYWQVLRNVSTDSKLMMGPNGYDQTMANETVVATIAWSKASQAYKIFARWQHDYLWDQSHAGDGFFRTQNNWQCWGRASAQSAIVQGGKLSFTGVTLTLDRCKWRCEDDNWMTGMEVKYGCQDKHPVCKSTKAVAEHTTEGTGCNVQLQLSVRDVQLAKPPAFGTLQLPAPKLDTSFLGGCEGKGQAKQCEKGTAGIVASVKWVGVGPKVSDNAQGPLPQFVDTKAAGDKVVTDVSAVTKCSGGALVTECKASGKCLITPKP